jgi:hypothetical protein
MPSAQGSLSAMRQELWLLPLMLLGLSGIGHNSVAQTPPLACQQQDKRATEFSIGGDFIEHDEDAKRFQDAFTERLQASNNLYWWGCATELLPESGIRIRFVSTQIVGDHGEILGSAIVASASRRSPKDPNAEHLIDIKHWFVRHDAPVEDIVLSYLNQLEDDLR